MGININFRTLAQTSRPFQNGILSTDCESMTFFNLDAHTCMILSLLQVVSSYVGIDSENDPISVGKDGKEVYFKEKMQLKKSNRWRNFSFIVLGFQLPIV